jgi:hypothetical protein
MSTVTENDLQRLDNLDFIAPIIIVSVAVALLDGLAKILYPNLMG